MPSLGTGTFSVHRPSGLPSPVRWRNVIPMRSSRRSLASRKRASSTCSSGSAATIQGTFACRSGTRNPGQTETFASRSWGTSSVADPVTAG